MRQAGRYLPEYRQVRSKADGFLNLCYTPDLAVEVTLQPLARFNMDAAILFSDILVVPDGLGQKVRFDESRGPILTPIRTKKQIDDLNLARMEEHLAPVYETVRRLSKAISKKTALIGFAGGPWTVAVYMVEGQGGGECRKIKDWAINKPARLQVLIDLLVEATARHLIRQVEHGVEAVQIFDSWAGVLDGPEIRRWVIEPTVAVVSKLRKSCPGVPVIGFPRAIGDLYEAYVKKTKVAGIGIDSGITPKWAAQRLQPLCAVQGNLDNQVLMRGGRALEDETRQILNSLGDGPFIFNLGHGILPQTPPENVAHLAQIIRDWKKN